MEAELYARLRRVDALPFMAESPGAPVYDDPRLEPRYDARLSELISDTADSVEPGEGLTVIRSRTRPDHHQKTTMSTGNSNGRNWLYAVGGAVAWRAGQAPTRSSR